MSDAPTKRCTVCAQVKPVAEFHRRPAMRDGYRNECRACLSERGCRWAAANRDRANALNRRSYRVHVERRIEYARRWQKENPDRVRAINHAYRARKRGNGSDLTAQDVYWMKVFGKCCGKCGVRLTDEPGPRQRQTDHIVTIVSGGPNTIANVRVLCRTCNLMRPKDGSDEIQLLLFAPLA